MIDIQEAVDDFVTASNELTTLQERLAVLRERKKDATERVLDATARKSGWLYLKSTQGALVVVTEHFFGGKERKRFVHAAEHTKLA